MAHEESPDTKRVKMEEAETDSIVTCKFFVKRKKRYCKLRPAHGEEYCGEHMPLTTNPSDTTDTTDSINKHKIRVPCPLDPKHTVCARKLNKHLKICNAAEKDRPNYIVPGLNAGKDDNEAIDSRNEFKLIEIDKETVDRVVEKVNRLYALHRIDEKIDDLMLSHHPLLASEISHKEYGHETVRHLIQTSTILRYLDHFKLFEDETSYVEYGAGRGQVSYWLAKAIDNYPKSNVLLIDRASVRHKKDNKVDNSHAVQRIRADIADFDIGAHSLINKSKKIVGIGKHLCGAATDFAIRCSIHGNNAANDDNGGPKTAAVLIAVCCHHRCDWKNLVGKEFFIENDVSAREFAIITKMVGWAICGTGMSREKRKQVEEEHANTDGNTTEHLATEADSNTSHRDRHQRKAIGQKCKRLIDYARICYMQRNGFKCSLKRYVSSDITLENICLVAIHENQ